MKKVIVILMFALTSCDSSENHGFRNGDAVLISGKYRGIVIVAKKGYLKDEYVRVEWISEDGEHVEDLDYRLLTKIDK